MKTTIISGKPAKFSVYPRSLLLFVPSYGSSGNLSYTLLLLMTGFTMGMGGWRRDSTYDQITTSVLWKRAIPHHNSQRVAVRFKLVKLIRNRAFYLMDLNWIIL